jgi:hypothetical protein
VEREHLRVEQQRAGQRHPLLLPAEELADAAARQIGQPHEVEHRADPPAPHRPRDAAHAEPERHVVARLQVREEQRLLEHHADGTPLGSAR